MALKKKWEERFAANQADYDAAVNKAQNPQANTALQDAQRRVAAANLQNTNANLARRTQQNPSQTPQGANTNPMTSEDVMNQWMNRGPFQYDMNADAMYQQYKDQYMRQGRLAMQDTIGRASTLTGGYGNSYATAAGQQQYNEYLAGLNDKALELSQMAYQRYQDEGDKLKDAYGMLYGRERDAVADEQWQKQFDEGVRQYDLNRADQREQFAMEYNLDVKKFEEDCRRYGLDYALAQAKQAHQEKMDQQEMDYKYAALNQDSSQFYANLDRQRAADARDYELALAKLGSEGSSLSSKKSSSKSGTVASVPYTKIGYKNLGEMTDKLPMKLMSGSKTPDDYLDKLYDKLDEWYQDGYIDETQVEALWNKFQPTDEMIKALKKAYPKSNGVSSGSTKRYTAPGFGKRADTVK